MTELQKLSEEELYDFYQLLKNRNPNQKLEEQIEEWDIIIRYCQMPQALLI